MPGPCGSWLGLSGRPQQRVQGCPPRRLGLATGDMKCAVTCRQGPLEAEAVPEGPGFPRPLAVVCEVWASLPLDQDPHASLRAAAWPGGGAVGIPPPEQPKQVAIPELLQTLQPGRSARHRAQKARGDGARQEPRDLVVRSGGWPRDGAPIPQAAERQGFQGWEGPVGLRMLQPGPRAMAPRKSVAHRGVAWPVRSCQ